MNDIKKRTRAPKQLTPPDVWPFIQKWTLEDKIKLRAELSENIGTELKLMELTAADMQTKLKQFQEAIK
jgi:hypothetical protein